MTGEKPLYRILVTGGAGFIGSHLVKKLLEDGHEVLCADNYLSGPRSNIADFYRYPNFEALRVDVTQDFNVECDRIYHLACPASPVHYQNNAIKTLKTNVIGTMNVLGIARRTGARVLLSSTSEVYGDPKEHPQKETYFGNVNPCGIRSCYDEGKRAAEALCMDYHRQHGIDVRIARIFNTYGPNMSALVSFRPILGQHNRTGHCSLSLSHVLVRTHDPAHDILHSPLGDRCFAGWSRGLKFYCTSSQRGNAYRLR